MSYGRTVLALRRAYVDNKKTEHLCSEYSFVDWGTEEFVISEELFVF